MTNNNAKMIYNTKEKEIELAKFAGSNQLGSTTYDSPPDELDSDHDDTDSDVDDIEIVSLIGTKSSTVVNTSWEDESDNDDGLFGQTTLLLGCALLVGCIVAVATLGLLRTVSSPGDHHNGLYGHQKTGVVGYNIDMIYPAFFHQSVFGGMRNIGHVAGARAHVMAKGQIDTEVTVPVSKVKRAVPSLHRENILNLWGHYVHDEHLSPFASFLYDRTQEELDVEQSEYRAKMAEVRSKWGAWSFVDPKGSGGGVPGRSQRPAADLGKNFEYKDFHYHQLPKGVWQRDEQYVTEFLSEAKGLVERVTEGIYAEYGRPTLDAEGKRLTTLQTEQRDRMFQLTVVPNDDAQSDPKEGAAWMTERAFDALVRKLLHAMITNDEFYVVMGGHSSAAGHGNNMLQEYMLSFHYLMEPVFQKLGVRLVSRNLAMGGLGTLHFSLGSRTLYGETDFLIWDSSMTEKGRGDKDLFNKQALLSGERVPIIFTNDIANLEKETDGTVLHGDMLEMREVIPVTEDLKQVKSLPWATQYMQCSSQCDECKDHKYSSSCWVPRSDFKPKVEQNAKVGGTASWHPGNREHHFTGRKIALTMLHGLKKAIETWEQGIATFGFPLKESYWHVGTMYKTLQTNLQTHLDTKNEKDDCEKRFPEFARACHVTMSGMGEFTPRATGYNDSIRNHLKPAPNGYVPTNLKTLYSGIDLLPLEWKVPHGEVDVHAIAIATNYKEPDINKLLGKKDQTSVVDTNNRQLLRKRLEEKLRNFQGSDSSHLQADKYIVSHDVKQDENRQLNDEDIIPGQGWVVDDPGSGLCDGSSNSVCNRYDGQSCLLSGHNDHRATLAGDRLSGWLVVKIPKLLNGLILARIESWHPVSSPRTAHWTEVNNGKTMDTRPYFNNTTGLPNFYDDVERKLGTNDFESDITDQQRELKEKIQPLAKDFKLDIAIDGKIVKTIGVDEIKEVKEVAYNQAIITLYDDKNTSKESGVELALRIRSDDSTARTGISISHIYYG